MEHVGKDRRSEEKLRRNNLRSLKTKSPNASPLSGWDVCTGGRVCTNKPLHKYLWQNSGKNRRRGRCKQVGEGCAMRRILQLIRSGIPRPGSLTLPGVAQHRGWEAEQDSEDTMGSGSLVKLGRLSLGAERWLSS